MKKFNLLACAAVAVAAGSFFATEAGALSFGGYGSNYSADGDKVKAWKLCSKHSAAKEAKNPGGKAHCDGHLNGADFNAIVHHMRSHMNDSCKGFTEEFVKTLWGEYYEGHEHAMKHASSYTVKQDLMRAINRKGFKDFDCVVVFTHKYGKKKHGSEPYHKKGIYAVEAGLDKDYVDGNMVEFKDKRKNKRKHHGL